MTRPVSKFGFVVYYHMTIEIKTNVKVVKEINVVNKSQL